MHTYAILTSAYNIYVTFFLLILFIYFWDWRFLRVDHEDYYQIWDATPCTIVDNWSQSFRRTCCLRRSTLVLNYKRTRCHTPTDCNLIYLYIYLFSVSFLIFIYLFIVILSSLSFFLSFSLFLSFFLPTNKERETCKYTSTYVCMYTCQMPE